MSKLHNIEYNYAIRILHDNQLNTLYCYSGFMARYLKQKGVSERVLLAFEHDGEFFKQAQNRVKPKKLLSLESEEESE